MKKRILLNIIFGFMAATSQATNVEVWEARIPWLTRALMMAKEPTFNAPGMTRLALTYTNADQIKEAWSKKYASHLLPPPPQNEILYTNLQRTMLMLDLYLFFLSAYKNQDKKRALGTEYKRLVRTLSPLSDTAFALQSVYYHALEATGNFEMQENKKTIPMTLFLLMDTLPSEHSKNKGNATDTTEPLTGRNFDPLSRTNAPLYFQEIQQPTSPWHVKDMNAWEIWEETHQITAKLTYIG